MQLAYSSLACPQWTIEEAVAAAVRCGYDAIEWRLADGEIITPETPAEVRRRLREVPADHGITVACLDTSCRVVQPSAQERAETIEAAQRMADIAVELGTSYMRVFGGALPPGETNASILAPTAEVVARIGAYCAERNITAVLETHDAWSRSDDVQALLGAVASPAVKMLWDIHHTYRSGEAPAQSVAQVGQAISFVHVKDGRPQQGDPNAWELCLLGEGTVPLHEAFSALKHAGYDGYISLEWEKKWHPEIAEPEVALPQGAPWLRRAWDEA
ncbi:MAG TPA: sugar phosphate isomerase/epimerase family protein [Ktedonobacteraceae bacterium]